MIKQPMTFMFGVVLRKAGEDEAILYDRVCGFKGCQKSLIGKWDWGKRKYLTFRCSKLDCKYGN